MSSKSQPKFSYHLLKLLMLFFALAFFSISSSNQVQANSKGYVKVTLQASQYGAPLAKASFTALNLQTAYNKISTGQYSPKDLESPTWTNMLQNFPHVGQTFDLTSKYILGPGKIYNDSDTKDIIIMLYNTGFSDFLRAINQSSSFDRFDSKFYLPGNQGRQYSSPAGMAEAELSTGLTGIIYQQRIRKLVTITAGMSPIAMDVYNTSSQLSLDIDNLSKSFQSGPAQYTVEYGKRIDYTFKLNSAFLTSDTVLTFTPSANLDIDSISAQYT